MRMRRIPTTVKGLLVITLRHFILYFPKIPVGLIRSKSMKMT